VQFFIGEKRLEFHGGQPIPTSRPQGGRDEAIMLRLTTADRAQEELSFRGEWGMARLFNAGKIDRLSGDKYRINWRLNVRNIYTANITGTVQSNMEALFDESVTRGFAVPKSLFKD
jgi:type VI protein secretion system component VasK